MEYALVALGGYLLGSIPFGLILTRLGGDGDIRSIGSGNIGATNVLRTGNKKLAAATLILDAFKGVAAVLLTYWFISRLIPSCAVIECAVGDDCGCHNYPQTNLDIYLYLAGFCAVIGHLFPVWLKFKGGKGVATSLGTILALQPIVGVISCSLWLLTALTTRYSSLSALVAVAAAPAVAHFLKADEHFVAMCGVIATLVFLKHRANIQRLLRGEEPKIGQKK